MEADLPELRAHEVKCPKCGQVVDRVSGEYARHYVVASVLCTASRREIKETKSAAGPQEGNS